VHDIRALGRDGQQRLRRLIRPASALFPVLQELKGTGFILSVTENKPGTFFEPLDYIRVRLFFTLTIPPPYAKQQRRKH
jgi:hypothetical protein